MNIEVNNITNSSRCVMSDSIFQEGGPFKVRRMDKDQYTFSVSIPTDEHGRIARQCPAAGCSPGYFKIKTGTGITGEQSIAFCPYCRCAAKPDDFQTAEQLRYAKDIVTREAHKGVQDMIGKALGLGPSGSKKIGGGFISMEMKYKPGSLPSVNRPMEDEIRRDVVCPHCGLDHAVYGIAVWCADCGKDIFIKHVETELSVISKMLSDIDRRRSTLGPRVAARDMENSLEDVVSIYEAVLKALVTRHLKESGATEEEIQSCLKKKVGNAFQNIDRSAEIFKAEFNLDLFEELSPDVRQSIKSTFEKRHPITHNLGVVDRKYLERALSDDDEGKEVRVTKAEIEVSVSTVLCLVRFAHSKLVKPVN